MKMGRFVSMGVLGIALAGVALPAVAQAPAPSQNVVSTSSSSSRSDEFTPSAVNIETLPSEDSEATIDPASLLPDLPSLPPAKATLIGGTILKLDRVRDEITVQIFGGGKMKIFFDPRTHIYSGPAAGLTSDLHQGDRVYVDTVLDGSTIFAKTIRLKSVASAGESRGIVTAYRSDRNELELRDVLSPRPLKVQITPQTKIVNGNRSASASQLVAGTLVALKFAAQQDGRDAAREVSILAIPGEGFTFAGRVTGLDLRLGLLVITSSTDNKSYEIYFDPSLLQPDENLRQSADVTVQARYDGTRYVARSVTVNSQSQ